MKRVKSKIHQVDRFPEHKILRQQLRGLDVGIKVGALIIVLQVAFLIIKHLSFTPAPLALIGGFVAGFYAYSKEGEKYKTTRWKIEESIKNEKEHEI